MRAMDRVEALSLFYPMYNEEANIEEAVARALSVLPRYCERFEIIVVNDGSLDRTGEIARALEARFPEVRAMHHPENRGYGAALRSGIQAARMPWIFYTDGDLQFDLEELPKLLTLRDRYEIVSGYRIDRKDPAHRKWNAAIFNLAVRVLFRVPGRDVDCAFKLYRAETVQSLPLRSNGAMIDVEIYARARRSGARIAEVPVRHFARLRGEQSGARLSVVARALRELFRLWWEIGR